MLSRLAIKNFVIVSSLEVDFNQGLSVLTGETGAGKSILIDALLLVLGQRAEGKVVRPGCDQAEINAEFDIQDPLIRATVQTCLSEQAIEMQEHGLLLRRVISDSGRSRLFVSGTQVTASFMEQLSAHLIHVYGQHDQLALFQKDYQRELLDIYAGNQQLVKQTDKAYQTWHALSEQLRKSDEEQEKWQKEKALVAFHLQEIESLSFTLQGWHEYETEYQRLNHVTELHSGMNELLMQLDETDFSVSSQTSAMLSKLDGLLRLDDGLKPMHEIMDGLNSQMSELVSLFRRYQDKLEADPARVDELNAYFAQVQNVARKHHIEPEALPELAESFAARLNELATQTDTELLEKQTQKAYEQWDELATCLTKIRTDAAMKLSETVTENMQDLAMQAGRFEVALLPQAKPSALGWEVVAFQVSPGAGQPLSSVAKTASGGELSRLGLAIQMVLSEKQVVPTMIFDEVDVGISGRVAAQVGRSLRQLGRKRQVLCVTHLAQVAALADSQYQITKEVSHGQASSSLIKLTEEDRIEEIARILGGQVVTETTKQHAKELLEQRLALK